MSRLFLGARGQDPVARPYGGCVLALQEPWTALLSGCAFPFQASVSVLLLCVSARELLFISNRLKASAVCTA